MAIDSIRPSALDALVNHALSAPGVVVGRALYRHWNGAVGEHGYAHALEAAWSGLRNYLERLIGTTRREYLDHMLFWNARDLERKLGDFQVYYNEVRSHASLKGHTPSTFVGGHMVTRAELNNVRWVSHCRDLVQLPVAG